MGDKALMFSSSGRAFLMYGKRGRSWIALFDPVGPREEWRDLVTSFVDLATGHGGRASFYRARPENVPFYLDLGFTAMKQSRLYVDVSIRRYEAAAARTPSVLLETGEKSPPGGRQRR